MVTTASLVPHANSGKIKILAVVSKKRIPALSNIPTMIELGYPELTNSVSVFGLAAPAGTPDGVLQTLEDLGFCAKGEGGDFVSGQRTAPGGDFPLNTSGGGLSYCHPGQYGVLLLVEAVRQLRGEAGARQVPGARHALAHGTGGILSTHATVVLGVEP